MREEVYYVNKIINLALFLIGFLLLSQLLVLLPILESRFYPVVVGFEITDIHALEGNLYVSGIMDKVRSCTPLDVTVWDRASNTLLNVINVDFKPDAFHEVELVLRQRPEGFQVWGPWGLEFTSEANESIVFKASHRCHPLWTTDTVIFDSLYEDLPNNIRFFSKDAM